MNMEIMDKKEEWYDWKWQLRNSQSALSGINYHRRTAQEFPAFITPYYASLIDKDNIPKGPVYRQAFPDAREIEDISFSDIDPLAEEAQMPVPHLIHRYKDRAVLLTSSRCAVHCRFCLRKRAWKNGTAPFSLTDEELAKVADYLSKHPEINEVLVSGGDPLMLENRVLEKIVLRISQVPSVDIIRVGTRVPVVLPMRVDEELAGIFSKVSGLWVATHFNHPVELTEDALEACGKFIRAGVPVVNQTVLLKGVNDDLEILVELFHRLAAARIKPHYLFHIDPVAGNAHFSTGINRGLELIRGFRNRLSSLETPQFAFDLPGGGGKVPLLPDYENNGRYEGLDGSFIEYY